MKRGKRGRKNRGRSRTHELRGNLEVITVDGVQCVRKDDLGRAAYGAALSMGYRDEQAAQVGGIILFDLQDQLARDGLQIFDEANDTLIEVGPRTDEDGMPQEIKLVERPRAVEWPAEIDAERGAK